MPSFLVNIFIGTIFLLNFFRNQNLEIMKHRPLSEIAMEIYKDWKKPYFGAVPYLNAMFTLMSINDPYYLDSGVSVVRYFLNNAKTWRGETARRIKAELKSML